MATAVKAPTLGYHEDASITKREIAQIQLSEAIDLFLAEKFLCALTLAGAADGVISGLLAVQGEKSGAELSADAALRIKSELGLIGLADTTKKQIFNAWNDARNRAKHHDKGEAETIVVNLFDEAYWMIRRALDGASRIGVDIGNAVDFENWVIVNINM